MELQLADIALNKKEQLKGFRVFGLFPFFVTRVTTRTQIELSRLRAQMRDLQEGEITIADFYNAELQSKMLPLLEDFCVTGLLNNRTFSWMLRPLLLHKLRKCGHYHILNLYSTIFKLSDPAFFLIYWKALNQPDHTILKADEQ